MAIHGFMLWRGSDLIQAWTAASLTLLAVTSVALLALTGAALLAVTGVAFIARP